MFKRPTTRDLFASFASGVNAPLLLYCYSKSIQYFTQCVCLVFQNKKILNQDPFTKKVK